MRTSPEKICQSFQRSFDHYHEAAIVQAEIARKLAYEFQHQTGEISRLLEFGAATGHLTEAFLKDFKIKTYFANDLVEESQNHLKSLFQDKETRLEFLKGDIETITLPEKLSVITSSSTMQWVQNPRQLLKRCHKALVKDGFLALSSFTPDHFNELRPFNDSATELAYLDEKVFSALLEHDFTVIKIWQEKKVLQFDRARDVLHHLRKTGVNANAGHHWTKKKLEGFEETYQKRFGKNGRVTLTYAPIYGIAQKV